MKLSRDEDERISAPHRREPEDLAALARPNPAPSESDEDSSEEDDPAAPSGGTSGGLKLGIVRLGRAGGKVREMETTNARSFAR